MAASPWASAFLVSAITETGDAGVTQTGTPNGDDLVGTDFDDILRGLGGGDCLSGGKGSDRLFGGGDDDTLLGGEDNDRLAGGSGSDRLEGGLGDDVYVVTDSRAAIVEAAGEGYDKVVARTDYQLAAGVEIEALFAKAPRNGVTLTGNELANRIVGGFSNDTLDGGDGNDVILGGDGDDTILGGAGDDKLVSGVGFDSYDGGEGIDTLSFADAEFAANVDLSINRILNDGDRSVSETVLNIENLIGSASSDILRGDGNANRIDGGDGGDMLRGNGGDDRLVGNAGDDLLTGGSGRDVLVGGSGNDLFIYASLADSLVGAERDVITDFTQGEDRIVLSQIDADATMSNNQAFHWVGASGFTGAAGELAQFAAGPNTLVAGDVDGDGTADFQILVKGAFTLTEADFLL